MIILSGNALVSSNVPCWVENRSYVALFANYEGIDPLLSALIMCESGFNPEVKGDKGLSRGILQFKEETFYAFCEGDCQWVSSEDQIRTAKKMIKMGLGPKPIGWKNCWEKMNLDKYF